MLHVKSSVEEIPANLWHHRVLKVIGDDIAFLISFYTISAVSNGLYYNVHMGMLMLKNLFCSEL